MFGCIERMKLVTWNRCANVALDNMLRTHQLIDLPSSSFFDGLFVQRFLTIDKGLLFTGLQLQHPQSQLFIIKIYSLTVHYHFVGQVKGQQQTSRSRSRCSLSQLPSATLRASRNTSIWCRRRTICSSPAILHSPYNWLLNSRSRFNFCICRTTR